MESNFRVVLTKDGNEVTLDVLATGVANASGVALEQQGFDWGVVSVKHMNHLNSYPE